MDIVTLKKKKPCCTLSLSISKGHSWSRGDVIEKLILESVPLGRGQTAGLHSRVQIFLFLRGLWFTERLPLKIHETKMFYLQIKLQHFDERVAEVI